MSENRTIRARCGRTDEHGYHRTPDSPGYCLGNEGVITGVDRMTLPRPWQDPGQYVIGIDGKDNCPVWADAVAYLRDGEGIDVWQDGEPITAGEWDELYRRSEELAPHSYLTAIVALGETVCARCSDQRTAPQHQR